MSFVSVSVTPTSDPIALLTQMVANDVDNETLRKGHSDYLGYVELLDNTVGSTYQYTSTGGQVVNVDPLELNLNIEEDGYYRIMFSATKPFSDTTTGQPYLGIRDKNMAGNNGFEVRMSYSICPASRPGSSVVWPPCVTWTDCWFFAGQQVDIVASVAGIFNTAPVVGIACSSVVTGMAFLTAYKVGYTL